MMTVSAVARLMPKPPALVDNRNTKAGASLAVTNKKAVGT